ncbi:hypothetical protein KLL36_12200 [Clostridioides difficile]|uniref:hypothetical protein n=1 Tax=Clostridioides difficile TaxID=1496 RepID=UPI000D1F8B9D|nr:hypothetical protein [Clostridioides difficile]MDL5067796.1 hypothetical protein [Clostridioides difficile]MDN9454199.1 hypothetical protein [Clostridioides difficile]HBF7899163.1 hypothetical protein [Clostridioides difficile]
MKKIYILDTEKGFNKILDNENITDISKRKKIDDFNGWLQSIIRCCYRHFEGRRELNEFIEIQ